MESCRLLGHSAGGFHRVAYGLWRPPGRTADAVVCVHGLTRNGRDFDDLAAALAEAGWLVACPDVVGRGDSDWLADPAGYIYPQYIADLTALVARLGVDEIDWIGTSMGGLIGMMMAAQPQTPIRRLVLNDIGPFIPKAAIERIASYVGSDPRFADLAEAEAYLRQIHEPFRVTDEQWRRLAAHSVRPDDGGRLRLRYDPAIAAAFAEPPFEDLDLWPLWDGIAVPTLVLRGAESDLLRPETAAEMKTRGPKAEVIEIPRCGHAPMLMDEAQISAVRDWLSSV
ncbi:MAG: alpha/beta hydrolase [Kiloniellales bacterium]